MPGALVAGDRWASAPGLVDSTAHPDFTHSLFSARTPRKPRGKSKRKAHVKEGESRLSERNVRLRADWRFATQPIVTPFTAGSSYAFLVADFGDPHYKQEDTSLNKALWDVWPVDAPDGYEKALKQAKAKRDV